MYCNITVHPTVNPLMEILRTYTRTRRKSLHIGNLLCSKEVLGVCSQYKDPQFVR
jgi:hypothetical protein